MDNIDKIIYINLERRKDRREEIEEEFRRMEIPQEKIIRFNAIANEIGMLGCMQSHIKVMEIAKEMGVKNVLILEDDFQFVVSKEELRESVEYFFQKIEDDKSWDVLMFGYNLGNPGNYSIPFKEDEKIGKIGYAQTASGYLVNAHYLETLINNLKEGYVHLEATKMHWLFLNDVYWKTLQAKDNWYYFIQRIGVQRVSYSDNGNGIAYYNC
jgi:glycosyl transferase family 25